MRLFLFIKRGYIVHGLKQYTKIILYPALDTHSNQSKRRCKTMLYVQV